MARQLSDEEIKMAPKDFIPVSAPSYDEYHCELITPMAGGGVKSWEPDIINPVRTQAIKGQLRFWWRTMQGYDNLEALKFREDDVWGSTSGIGKAIIQVQYRKVAQDDIITIQTKPQNNMLDFSDAGLPGYVLFPLQGQKDNMDRYELIGRLKFTLKIVYADNSYREEITNSIRLWLLFGGLGARTRRGCGSLYCKEVMKVFDSPEKIYKFIRGLWQGKPPESYSSPWPVLGNARLAFKLTNLPKSPQKVWCNFLKQYGNFRQGQGIARNQGQRNRPGRTKWPEADAIRRLTGKHSDSHKPEHPAGNWFPRGAYGLPIQTEFKNAQGDPEGKFMLQPSQNNFERWPSPVILKIIRFDDSRFAQFCLILNHKVPNLLIKSKTINTKLPDSAHPLACKNKKMPQNANMLHSGENPYDALIRHLGLEEITK